MLSSRSCGHLWDNAITASSVRLRHLLRYTIWSWGQHSATCIIPGNNHSQGSEKILNNECYFNWYASFSLNVKSYPSAFHFLIYIQEKIVRGKKILHFIICTFRCDISATLLGRVEVQFLQVWTSWQVLKTSISHIALT